jgi:catechol 2,3-dioxygenase-like lactoylglutathione lyase family enzyme
MAASNNLTKKMSQRIAHITLVVDDYDQAIEFYTRKLDFELLEDTRLNENKRWVLVSPKNSNGPALLLAKAANEEQKSRIGNQTGGRVFLLLFTDDFASDYQKLLDNKITITRPPIDEPYGTVLVFSDLYGNLWDLIQPKS